MKPIPEPHDFYVEQLEAMEAFFLDPDASLMRLVLDPELQNMPINFLVQRDEQPDFPHLLIGYFEPTQDPVAWLDGLIELTNGQVSENVEEGRNICVPSNVRAETAPNAERNVWGEFIAGINDFSESLPDHVGALVFVIDALEIENTDIWLERLNFFADRSRSPWVKLLVLEPRSTQPFASLEDHDRVDSLLFWMSPEEIERRADIVLQNSGGLKGYM